MPPLRTLQLRDSDYALEANALAPKLHIPETNYHEKILNLSKQTKTLCLLQAQAAQEHISDLASHEYSAEAIARQLSSSYGIDLSFLDNPSCLTSPSELETIESTLEAKYQALKTEYEQAMNQAIQAQREEIAEADEKKREVLKFIQNIGFDLLPKSFTDVLIQEIRSGLIQPTQLKKFNPANLDLANGHF